MRNSLKVFFILLFIIAALGIIPYVIPQYKTFLLNQKENAYCRLNAQKYVSDWEKRATALDDAESVTTVPGQHTVHYNSVLKICAAHVKASVFTDQYVRQYDGLMDTATDRAIAQREIVIYNNGTQNDSNPEFSSQLKNFFKD